MNASVAPRPQGNTSHYCLDVNLVASGRDTAEVVGDDQRSLRDLRRFLQEVLTRTSTYAPPEQEFNAHRSLFGVTAAPNARIRLLHTAQLYRMRDRENVTRFLMKHSEVVSVLAEAVDPVRDCFGGDSQVTLQVIDAPDVGGRATLLARVRTRQSVDEAFANLQAFGRNWFTQRFTEVDGLVNFDVVCA